MIRRIAATLLLAALAGCGDGEKGFDPNSQIGPHPNLPAQQQYLIPPIHVAKVIGWKASEHPTAPAGLAVKALARDLQHPRNLYVLPNGDILVVESQGPNIEPVTRPKSPLIHWIEKRATSQAGADNGPSNRITLLRDANGDGVPELRTTLIDHLNSPFGIAFADNYLYVAATDAILRYPYSLGETSRISAPPAVLTPLPGGPIDHHWTKSLTLSPDGKMLYATVGSNSNIVENGFEAEHGRAAVWEVDRATGRSRIFATGLRNPNSPTFYPGTNTFFVVVNERDELGPNLVPDYLTSVREGGFYGWPYSYYGNHVDPRVHPQSPAMVARAIVPDYALGSHVAALGLAFYTGDNLPAHYRGGAFVGEHGSWDRQRFNGYKVAFVPFAGGKPSGMAEDFLTGFLAGDGKTHGRPVGVAVDRFGALLVADDVGNVVWRVSRGS